MPDTPRTLALSISVLDRVTDSIVWTHAEIPVKEWIAMDAGLLVDDYALPAFQQLKDLLVLPVASTPCSEGE